MKPEDENPSNVVDMLKGSENASEDVEHDSKELVLHRYFLQEWSILKSLLEAIVAAPLPDLSSAHNIRSIVDKYQEQGQLLEPYLEAMVTPLMEAVRCKSLVLSSDENSLPSIKRLCVAIYSLATVCGYKSVIRFFPHHVSDLELAVALLEKCHVDSYSVNSLRQESTGEMEAKCVTLLWLSILVLVPFDISTVDTYYQESNENDEIAPLVQKIMNISMDYLSSAGPMRSTSSLLLSKLLTRPDMPTAFNCFVDWSRKILHAGGDEISSHFCLLGTIEALAAIFKIGSRNMLVGVIPAIWKEACALLKSNAASRSPLLRKHVIKLTQRIGLVSLPYRSAVWHYVGTKVSLEANFLATDPVNDDCGVVQRDEEDMNVPVIVEDIIEMLFSGLRDTDTVVRWSAAKGIGRITLRLSSSLAEEVLGSLLELFAPGEGDGSWHGACLGLAELARRGLLLPGGLSKVVPLVIKALHYDVRRGAHSVGSHVRDAAAYVCWAFGRAYSKNDMRNIFEQLAPHLLTISCYDREVNCRRAAAAAFQENIGRQGAYPNGIELVNAADYFSLSSRTNSYKCVAVNIAQYEGYLLAFVDDLLHTKINHWDKGLRELATLGLAALAKYDVDYFSKYVLEKLIPLTLSVDLCSRHGSTLAAGEVVLALHHCGVVLSPDKQKSLAGVVPAIEKARLYRGKGGEIMRASVSRFIECMAESHVTVSEKTKQILLATLNENLRHPNFQIQNAAARALKQFVKAHVIHKDSITPNYLNQLNHSNVAVRRGSALALAVLPYEFFANCWEDALLKLSHSCLVEKNPEDRDAEARVNAVKAVVSVSETIIQSRKEHDPSIYNTIKNVVVKALLEALDDYCTDNRGDVGSWVREASLIGLETCTYLLCRGNSLGDEIFFDSYVAQTVIGGIIKQAVEKLDKLRVVSALVLQRILHNNSVFVPLIPHREVLEKIIPEGTDFDWGAPSLSFPRFVSLLQFPVYSKTLLSGLVTSSGGLQNSLRKAAVSALVDYLNSDEASQSSRLCSLSADLLWILRQYKKIDRIIVPTLKSIEILSSKKIFIHVEHHATFLECIKFELKGSKDFSKLYCGMSVLGYMSSLSGTVSRDAFACLLMFLVNRYPKIRKGAADQVYLILLQREIEKGVEIVSETCWDGDVEVAKRQFSKLMEVCEFVFDNSVGCLSDRSPAPISLDENAHYSSLVHSSGF